MPPHIQILLDSITVMPIRMVEIWDWNPHNAGKCWQYVPDDPRYDALREWRWNDGTPLDIDVDALISSRLTTPAVSLGPYGPQRHGC